MRAAKRQAKFLLPAFWLYLSLAYWVCAQAAHSSDGKAPFFSDDFSSPSLQNWQVIDEGTVDGPSHWTVEDGTLIQTSPIYSKPTTGKEDLYQKGTLLVAGDARWTDYELDVRLNSLAFGSLGVVFRFQDPDHTYRFSLDAAGSNRKLAKIQAERTEVLAQDHFRYEPGVVYSVRVIVIGNWISVLQNGKTVFSAKDSGVPLKSGKIGLYSFHNKGSCFDEIRVAVPSNLPPHFLPLGDQVVSAGTQLEFMLKATDPNGNPLVFRAENLPDGAVLKGGAFSWIPLEAQVGEYALPFVVTDGELQDQLTVNVSVLGATEVQPTMGEPTAAPTAPGEEPPSPSIETAESSDEES